MLGRTVDSIPQRGPPDVDASGSSLRSDPKYRVPSAATDGLDSLWSVLTGAPRFRGAPQPLPLFSTTQMSASARIADPSRGRSEPKKSFEPSGDRAGEKSGHTPEKGAISGVVQRPLSSREKKIAWTGVVEVVGDRRAKNTVLPSGESAEPNSSSGVETTPGAKRVASKAPVLPSAAAASAAEARKPGIAASPASVRRRKIDLFFIQSPIE